MKADILTHVIMKRWPAKVTSTEATIALDFKLLNVIFSGGYAGDNGDNGDDVDDGDYGDD